ncbi:unnamed protein product [Schistosoma turkestanicum]|nr:unnamed protein product [Schistosoma turkestanicum]
MPTDKSISEYYTSVGYKLTPEIAPGNWENSSTSSNQVFTNDSGSTLNGFDPGSRFYNVDTSWKRKPTATNEVLFGMFDETSSNSFSSPSSDPMSSSVIEGGCCEEHLSLTREMAVRLLKEYVKNLKNFSSMMREKQSTTLRDISTSPIHSPVLENHDKQGFPRKRETPNSDNTVSRQRPSSILGLSDMHRKSYDLVQSDRPQTPPSFLSSFDHIIDVPVTSMKKHLFPGPSISKVTNQSIKPNESLEKSHPANVDKQNWFNRNSLDSDDSGQQTPVNFEPTLQTAVLKSEKYYQLEKDPGHSVPILSITNAFESSQPSKNYKKETQKHLDKIAMLPPQPDILRFERPHKPNVINADEKLNGEGIVTERQSEINPSSPNQIFHMQISSDVSKMERLRIKSPSPSYSSSFGSSENSFGSLPPKPEYHSSPTPQAKPCHSYALRSSSVQRVIPTSTKETLWVRNSYNTSSLNSHRSLVKSSSSIPLSGTPSYSDSILPKINPPLSQNISTSNSTVYLESETNQPQKHIFNKSGFDNSRFNNKAKTGHVTEANKPPPWSVNSRFSTNNSSKDDQNSFQNYANHPPIKTYTESGVQSVPTSNGYTFANKNNKTELIRKTDDTPTLVRGTRARIAVEDSALSPEKLPKKYGFWSGSDQLPPTVSQKVNAFTKPQDYTSQYKSNLFYQRKFDKTTQTDDFVDDDADDADVDADSWITGSLDSSNNQDVEIPCEAEIPKPVNEPNLQTWTLSLQSIVRPTESEIILPKTNEINSMEHVNVHIEKTKSSESKLQSNLDYHKELWRRHSLRVIPSEFDTHQTMQRNVDHFNDQPNSRHSLSRKPKNTSRFSIGSSGELDTPKCRSVHFSNDVLVAHTGSGPEPLLLSSAPLKESVSDDEEGQNGYFTEKKSNYFTKLSVDCGQNITNFSKPPKSRTNMSRPSAPLPFRRQFVLNTSDNVDF